MRRFARIAALVGLGLVIVPPIVYYGTLPRPDLMATLMLVGTVVWFVCSYLGFRQNADVVALDEEVEAGV